MLTRTGAQWLRPTDKAGETGGESADAPGTRPLWDAAIAPTCRGATPSDEPVPAGPVRIVRTPRVVLACSAPAARRLLDGAGCTGAGPSIPSIPVGAPIARFMLVARVPDLEGAPVGSGLLVAEAESCPVRAKALSHLSVKWPWIETELAARHGPDVHALRLSYGRPGPPPPTTASACSACAPDSRGSPASRSPERGSPARGSPPSSRTPADRPLP